LGERVIGQIEFRYVLSAAVTNLPSFAELVLKLRVCYVPSLETVQPSILQ